MAVQPDPSVAEDDQIAEDGGNMGDASFLGQPDCDGVSNPMFPSHGNSRFSPGPRMKVLMFDLVDTAKITMS